MFEKNPRDYYYAKVSNYFAVGVKCFSILTRAKRLGSAKLAGCETLRHRLQLEGKQKHVRIHETACWRKSKFSSIF